MTSQQEFNEASTQPVTARLNPPITPAVLDHAFAIASFIKSGHPNSSTVDEETKHIIRSITARHPTSEKYQKHQRTHSQRATRSNPAPVLHKPDWVTDLSTFKEDVRRFIRIYKDNWGDKEPPTPSDTFSISSAATKRPFISRQQSRETTIELPEDLQRRTPESDSTMDGRQTTASLDDIRRLIESSVNFAVNAAVNSAVDSAVDRALGNMSSNPGPPGPHGPPGPPSQPATPVNNNGSTTTPSFRARDVGYFDPNPDVEPVEVKETHQVYHNVFSFTNRVKARAVTMDATLLRNNLLSCLIGESERWYTEELSPITRIGLQNTGINEWCEHLEQRFRDPPGRSLAASEQERYTVIDVRRRREPARYVQSIVLLGRNAGIATTEAAQVIIAYEHMDPQLRQHLALPNERSTVETFIRELNIRKYIWFDMYTNNNNRVGTPSRAANNPPGRQN